MGLLARISGDLVEELEWQNKEQNRLVYRFEKYKHHIKIGGRILVRENETAVFASMGKTADVLGPGEYTLDSSVLPLLAGIQDWKKTKPESFISDIIYINTRQIDGIPWNTLQPLVLDYAGRKVRIRLRGKFSVKAVDCRTLADLLINETSPKVSGTASIFREHIISVIKNKVIDSNAEIMENNKFLTDADIDKIQARFLSDGVELTGITVDNIAFPDSAVSDDYSHSSGDFLHSAYSSPSNLHSSDSLFYTIEEGRQTGPFNYGQLAERVMKNEIGKTTYVWTNGMEKWQTAGTVRELQTVFSKPL